MNTPHIEELIAQWIRSLPDRGILGSEEKNVKKFVEFVRKQGYELRAD